MLLTQKLHIKMISEEELESINNLLEDLSITNRTEKLQLSELSSDNSNENMSSKFFETWEALYYYYINHYTNESDKLCKIGKIDSLEKVN